MWKLKSTKAFLSNLLLLLFCVFPVFSVEDTSDLQEFQKIAQELSNSSQVSQSNLNVSNQNLTQEYNNVNNFKDSSTNLDLSSMNPFELLDLLEQNLNKADLRLKEATRYSMSLEQDLLNTRLELDNSKKTLLSLKQALISNKEDTSTVISELGLLYEKTKDLNEKVEQLTKVKKRIKVTSYIELGVGVPCLVLGVLPIWTDQQKNIQNLLLGIGATATASGLVTFSFTLNF